MVTVIAVCYVASQGASAFAETVEKPAPALKFMALDKTKTAKLLPPKPSADVGRFLPLKPHRNFVLLRPAVNTQDAPSPSPSVPSTMTPQQAHQLLSIFAPDG